MARRPLIGTYNRALESAAAFTGGSWTAPLSNLTDHNPQKVAESADHTTANTQFDIDLGAEYTIGAISFAELLATSSAATMTVQLFNAAAGSTYNSGSTTIWSGDSNEWEALGRCKWFVPSAPVLCKTAQIRFVTSAVAGTLKLGCFGLWQTWEPADHGLAPGWNIEYLDDSPVDRVPGGSTYITELPTRRLLNFGLGPISASDVANARALSVIKGAKKPLIAIPMPDDTTNLERTAVYGLRSGRPAISNPFYGLYETTFAIEQLR